MHVAAYMCILYMLPHSSFMLKHRCGQHAGYVDCNLKIR